MNLLDALKTGNDIKRSSGNWFKKCMTYALAKEFDMIGAYHDGIPRFLPPHIAIRNLDIVDILATDWEVMEKKVEITKEQFEKTFWEALREQQIQRLPNNNILAFMLDRLFK